MQQCSIAPAFVTKEGSDKVRDWRESGQEWFDGARHSAAILDYSTRDRPQLSLASRMISQQMSKPTEGRILESIPVRYLQTYPIGGRFWGAIGEYGKVKCGPTAFWVEMPIRRFCSGGEGMRNRTLENMFRDVGRAIHVQSRTPPLGCLSVVLFVECRWPHCPGVLAVLRMSFHL